MAAFAGRTWVGAALVLGAAGLAGCASTGSGDGYGGYIAPEPLNPLVARSGGPLSARDAALDVQHYALDLEIDPDQRTLSGFVTITARMVEATDTVEFDLDGRFAVSAVFVGDQDTDFARSDTHVIVPLAEPAGRGDEIAVTIAYAGAPHVAERAPWDGGWVWAYSADGQPWTGVAVQGAGCDLWFACKDHVEDEPDRGVELAFTVPAGLTAAANGVLVNQTTLSDGRARFEWTTHHPVNPYNINVSVGPFVAIERTYAGILGVEIPVVFYALPENAVEAERLVDEDLFAQLIWFENEYGPYPWGDEKIGLVETPYLGMEHQTINAYGAGYAGGKHGYDWLMHHELAHEWFGNMLSHASSRDIWLHEGFGSYVQAIYAAEVLGDPAAEHWFHDARLRMQNCRAIVQDGPIFDDQAYTSDIYSKAALVLRTLRHHIGDAAFDAATRIALYDTADPSTLQYPIAARQRTSEEFVAIVEAVTGRDLGWFFDVYLFDKDLPTLEVYEHARTVQLTWRHPRYGVAEAGPADSPFILPVPVEFTMPDGIRRIQSVAMPGGQARIVVPDGARVRIDPAMLTLRALDVRDPFRDPVVCEPEEVPAS